MTAPTCHLAGGWDESSRWKKMVLPLVSSGGPRKPSLPSGSLFDYRWDFTETWLDEDDLEHDDRKLTS